MRLTSTGLGIGTSSPTAKLDIQTAANGIGFSTYSAGETAERTTYTAAPAFQIAAYQSVSGSPYTKAADLVANADGTAPSLMRFWTKTNGASSPAERMRLDSSGNLLVGTTTSSARLTVQADSSVVQPVVFNTTASGTGATSLVRFRRNGTNVGEIEVTGSATTYATSSDYRLKENVQPMTGALAKVQALKPVAYKWKIDGSSGEGFIAHELQEFCPDAVTGEKDAVDAEGNPKYQGIDTSFLVATLTAAIQEQQALIDAQQAALQTLTARVEALESN
jgi:hypothetical protein